MNLQEATPIELTKQERSALETMIRSPKAEHGIVERARIVLLAVEGRSTHSIADELGTWPGRVSRWRTRFARERVGGLRDLPRPGPTPRYTVDTDKRILAQLDQAPPAGYGGGPRRCCRASWSTCRTSTSGASCVSTRSTWRRASRGASDW